jgi:hypothetical protein
LNVLTPLNRARVAEGIDIRLVEISLVQVPRIAEEAEIDLTLVAVEEQESHVGNVTRHARFGSVRCRGWARRELAGATV